jgi:hypothetical protein
MPRPTVPFSPGNWRLICPRNCTISIWWISTPCHA